MEVGKSADYRFSCEQMITLPLNLSISDEIRGDLQSGHFKVIVKLSE